MFVCGNYTNESANEGGGVFIDVTMLHVAHLTVRGQLHLIRYRTAIRTKAAFEEPGAEQWLSPSAEPSPGSAACSVQKATPQDVSRLSILG